MENIFSRLYKYKPQPNMTPEENFFTESFKFVLESDQVLCEKFVKFISGENIFTPPFRLGSQVRYNSSIIDLEIIDKDGRKIFIEIKVSAHENKYFEEEDDFGQIEKYLRLNTGHVCFISQREEDVQIKTNAEKYLGQFEWFQVYELIEEHLKNRQETSELNLYFITNFLKFMKDLDMQPFQGFTEDDIKISQTTVFNLCEKLFGFLDYSKRDKDIANFFRRINLKFSSAPSMDRDQNIFVKFQLTNYKDFWGYFGFNFDNKDNGGSPSEKPGIYFFLNICIHKDKVGVIKSNVGKFDFNQKYFLDEECLQDEFVVLNKVYFSEFIKDGEKRAMKYIYESFLELERKNVFKEIEKVLQNRE